MKTKVVPPTGKQLRKLFGFSMVPFIGFGFMDNLVMIQAGDLIDTTLGVKFGLATLTAAAIGQIFSDVSGVCFGGTMEAMAIRFGMSAPSLTAQQRSLKICRRVTTAGSAVGVALGCILGMTSLLFMDLQKAEREKKRKALSTILRTVMVEGHELAGADRSSLFLVDYEKGEVWSTVATGMDSTNHKGKKGRAALSKNIRVPLGQGIVGNVAVDGELVNIRDAYKDHRFDPSTDKVTGYHTKSVLCAPVLLEGRVVAVVQFVNKEGGIGFNENDENICHLLCRHIAIFMQQVETED